MKKCSCFVYPLILLVALSLAGCNRPSQTQGPTTWIDRPLDGTHVPLASLEIMAHASDANGVSTIEFYLAEGLLSAVPTAGGRLGEASIEWMPPAAGSYLISARAVDSQGNAGPLTSVNIIVGTKDLMTETPAPAAAIPLCTAGQLTAPLQLSPVDGAAIEAEPLFSWSYDDEICHPDSFKIDISEDVSFSDVSLGFGTLNDSETSRQWPLPSGTCYYWRVLAYVPDTNGPSSPAWYFCLGGTATPSPQIVIWVARSNSNCRFGPGTAYDTVDVLLAGQEASIEGKNQDGSWFLVHMPHNTNRCWVSLATGEVEGDLDSVPLVNPPPLPTGTLTQLPADTTPPGISDISVSPLTIQKAGCGGQTTTFASAKVSDAGGVQSVVARIPGFGEVTMSPAGGGVYQATLGPFDTTGDLSLLILARDSAGNSAQAGPINITVVCIQ